MDILTILTWCRKYHDLVAAVAIVVATTGAFNLGKSLGASRAHEQDEEKAALALQQADTRYRAKENEHEKEISELRMGYAATSATAAAVDSAVAGDLGTGVKRLRLPVASRCPNAATTGSAAIRVDAKARAELTPEAARSLYGIAADGDTAIRQLAALQEWALGAVNLCNGGKR